MGAQYKTCPYCGAHLDHGERCDCLDRAQEERETTRITPPGRAYGPAIVGMDLARGKDFTATAKPYISRAQKEPPALDESVGGATARRADCYTIIILTPPGRKCKGHKSKRKGGF